MRITLKTVRPMKARKMGSQEDALNARMVIIISTRALKKRKRYA